MDTTQRKTKKYYRELIAKQMLYTPVGVIGEVVTKYAPKNKYHTEVYLNKDIAEFQWNHRLEYIGVNKKSGRVYLDIYWQGDSTDGNESVVLTDVINAIRSGRYYVIPAEHEFIGDRTYCRHGDIRISKEEVENAYKALISYLTKSAKKK